MITVTPIPILSDNYAWLLRDEESGCLAVVDPADPAPVAAAIDAAGGKLDMILLTHHHGDHVAGTDEIRARYGAQVVGARADRHRLPKLDREVWEGSEVDLGASTARVYETPGHTRGHISFYFPDGGVLLCGDTLFSLGCGRLLEGTAAEMFNSLMKFAALPGATLVCCGHEYTESNARFALHADPENLDLHAYAERVKELRAMGLPTLPSKLSDELECNPFLRAGDVATLADLRARKDKF
ncbi:MAG: hydroxyacylglutathione hydrolase [Rhodospirillales bacterium 70-18]|nr:hydroxyacylglutathione hydrolase [Rhodospirillales bacterium]OJY70557.1 MAG: hydroxyacylglutathione hydrolase [Rhodospirillales bacterium 70-18]